MLIKLFVSKVKIKIGYPINSAFENFYLWILSLTRLCYSRGYFVIQIKAGDIVKKRGIDRNQGEQRTTGYR